MISLAILDLLQNSVQAAYLGCFYSWYSPVKTAAKDMKEKHFEKNDVEVPPRAQVVVHYQKTDPEHEQWYQI